MNPHLKLSHKGLILVAVPLAFELLFVLVLMGLLKQSDQEAVRADQARAVVRHLNNLHLLLMKSSGSMVAYIFSGNPNNLEHSQKDLQPVEGELKTLAQLTRDRPVEAQALQRINELCDRAQQLLAEMKTEGDEGLTRKNVYAVKKLMKQLADETEGIVKAENKMDEDSPKLQSDWRELINKLVLAVLLLNVLLAVSLAVYFNSGTTSRLGVLMDNTQRLAQGMPLNPPLQGGDEIAHLDRVFAQMSQTLKESTDKEHVVMDLLRESENNLRRILESMPVGLVILDEDGRIEMMNTTVQKMFGANLEELEGHDLTALLQIAAHLQPSGSAPGFTQGSTQGSTLAVSQRSSDKSAQGSLDDLLEQAERKAVDLEVVTFDGNPISIEVTLTRFSSRKGERLLAMILDVTLRKEMERLKREFVAMVSHDLRTPLSSVHGSLTLLSQGVAGELSDGAQDILATAESEIERLTRLVNDLLDLAKMEAGRMKVDLEEISLGPIVRRAVAAVANLAERKGMKILAPETDLKVLADSERLIQVLVNLLSNAVKFSPDGESVEVSAQEIPGWVEVSVIDHGRGVPESHHEAIFERFQQVEKQDATEKGGTGLGLPICKTIIEEHGGTIGVESEVNKGSKFWFRLKSAGDHTSA